MGILIKDLIHNGILNNGTLLDTIKCDCGCELKISESLGNLKCANISCSNTKINRFNNILKNIDKYSLNEVIKKYRFETPYQLLYLDEIYKKDSKYLDSIPNIKLILLEIKSIKEKEYTLPEIAKLCGVETITLLAEKLFSKYDKFSDFYEEIQSGQIYYINELLGMKNNELSLNLYYRLINVQGELEFAQTVLKTKKDSKDLYRIIIGHELNSYVNKTEFIEFIECTYNIRLVLTNSVRLADIIITNKEPGNTKEDLARQLNIERHNDINKLFKDEKSIAILSIKEFIDKLENLKENN